MTTIRSSKEAFGKPGIDPRWTDGNKDGAGTAYSTDSPVWFTLWNGAITEVFYPTLDRPQIRDLQYMVSDGTTFLHEEKRDLESKTERFPQHTLGYKVVNSDRKDRYRIVKEVIVSPHLPCVLQHTRLEGDDKWLAKLRLFALCAPHLQVGGWGNNAYVVEAAKREILVAEKEGIWLAFGDGLHSAVTSLLQGLGIPFQRQRDKYPTVLNAAGFLIRHGPATEQERWEEAAGYSPSTLASNIAALICAACLARQRGDKDTAQFDKDTAQFIEQYADFLECHLESWTVTTEGTLVPDLARHFIRLLPIGVDDFTPNENPNHGTLTIANRNPESKQEFAAKDIVDAGFLELVCYGIRKPDDPLIRASLRVVDAILKVETPNGPCWRRYNHDGYGQRDDGGPFNGWGKGRAWPLLTGERAHYELAAGHNVSSYIRAMENLASSTGLLPEQVWDEEDQADIHMFLGRPTGSAVPLMWAHSEYIQLLRSVADGDVFARVPPVVDRYLSSNGRYEPLEIWKPNRQPRQVKRGFTLRVQTPRPFRLCWTQDEWHNRKDSASRPTGLGIEYADIPVDHNQHAPIRFTFFWTDEQRWEGRDYEVTVVD